MCIIYSVQTPGKSKGKAKRGGRRITKTDNDDTVVVEETNSRATRAKANLTVTEEPSQRTNWAKKSADSEAILSRYDADILVVVAYGLILPAAILGIPRLGCLNVHASLLPRWRGAAPESARGRPVVAYRRKRRATHPPESSAQRTPPPPASVAPSSAYFFSSIHTKVVGWEKEL